MWRTILYWFLKNVLNGLSRDFSSRVFFYYKKFFRDSSKNYYNLNIFPILLWIILPGNRLGNFPYKKSQKRSSFIEIYHKQKHVWRFLLYYLLKIPARMYFEIQPKNFYYRFWCAFLIELLRNCFLDAYSIFSKDAINKIEPC